MPKRQHKYRARATVVDGHRFPSRREAARYRELRLLERSGAVRHLELQPRFPLEVNGTLVCTYVADFRYRTPDGVDVIEDVKGVRTQVYRIKRKLLRALHGIEIREV